MSTNEERARDLAHLKRSGGDRRVTGEGVLFLSEQSARVFCDQHDKDLVRVEGPPPGWLAKNRKTNSGPMPTKEGDIVIEHINQLFLVWVVTKDGAQEHDPNIAPLQVWSRAEADQAANNWAQETNGRIFLHQKDGDWAIKQS